jgi:hypothetical protein
MLTSLFLSPPPDGVAGMLFFFSLVLVNIRPTLGHRCSPKMGH